MIRFAETVINKFLNKKTGINKDFVCVIDTDSTLVDFDDVAKIGNIKQSINELQTVVNTSFEYFAKNYFNSTSNLLSMKQEMIADGAIFIGKKKYVLNVIEREGVPVSDLEIKGIDVVRSNFPPYFRFLSRSITDL